MTTPVRRWHRRVTAGYNSIADGTNFANGEFTVDPGQSIRGWVAFELPPGVSVASVQFSRREACAVVLGRISRRPCRRRRGRSGR
jgi:hypothetical protein